GRGLLLDPVEVVGVAVDDRPRGHARHLVGMLALRAGDDVGYPATAGVHRYPALDPLMDFALPGVYRPDRGEVVRAGGQAVLPGQSAFGAVHWWVSPAGFEPALTAAERVAVRTLDQRKRVHVPPVRRVSGTARRSWAAGWRRSQSGRGLKRPMMVRVR